MEGVPRNEGWQAGWLAGRQAARQPGMEGGREGSFALACSFQTACWLAFGVKGSAAPVSFPLGDLPWRVRMTGDPPHTLPGGRTVLIPVRS